MLKFDNKEETYDFLKKMTNNKLKQLCAYLNIPLRGTKDKLIQKIMKESTLIDIRNIIDESRKYKYMAVCNEYWSPDDWPTNWMHFTNRCHSYFTNTMNSPENCKTVGNHRRTDDEDNTLCEKCHKLCSIDEYDNEFYEEKNHIKR